MSMPRAPRPSALTAVLLAAAAVFGPDPAAAATTHDYMGGALSSGVFDTLRVKNLAGGMDVNAVSGVTTGILQLYTGNTATGCAASFTGITVTKYATVTSKSSCEFIFFGCTIGPTSPDQSVSTNKGAGFAITTTQDPAFRLTIDGGRLWGVRYAFHTPHLAGAVRLSGGVALAPPTAGGTPAHAVGVFVQYSVKTGSNLALDEVTIQATGKASPTSSDPAPAAVSIKLIDETATVTVARSTMTTAAVDAAADAFGVFIAGGALTSGVDDGGRLAIVSTTATVACDGAAACGATASGQRTALHIGGATDGSHVIVDGCTLAAVGAQATALSVGDVRASLVAVRGTALTTQLPAEAAGASPPQLQLRGVVVAGQFEAAGLLLVLGCTLTVPAAGECIVELGVAPTSSTVSGGALVLRSNDLTSCSTVLNPATAAGVVTVDAACDALADSPAASDTAGIAELALGAVLDHACPLMATRGPGSVAVTDSYRPVPVSVDPTKLIEIHATAAASVSPSPAAMKLPVIPMTSAAADSVAADATRISETLPVVVLNAAGKVALTDCTIGRLEDAGPNAQAKILVKGGTVGAVVFAHEIGSVEFDGVAIGAGSPTFRAVEVADLEDTGALTFKRCTVSALRSGIFIKSSYATGSITLRGSRVTTAASISSSTGGGVSTGGRVSVSITDSAVAVAGTATVIGVAFRSTVTGASISLNSSTVTAIVRPGQPYSYVAAMRAAGLTSACIAVHNSELTARAPDFGNTIGGQLPSSTKKVVAIGVHGSPKGALTVTGGSVLKAVGPYGGAVYLPSANALAVLLRGSTFEASWPGPADGSIPTGGAGALVFGSVSASQVALVDVTVTAPQGTCIVLPTKVSYSPAFHVSGLQFDGCKSKVIMSVSVPFPTLQCISETPSTPVDNVEALFGTAATAACPSTGEMPASMIPVARDTAFSGGFDRCPSGLRVAPFRPPTVTAIKPTRGTAGAPVVLSDAFLGDVAIERTGSVTLTRCSITDLAINELVWVSSTAANGRRNAAGSGLLTLSVSESTVTGRVVLGRDLVNGERIVITSTVIGTAGDRKGYGAVESAGAIGLGATLRLDKCTVTHGEAGVYLRGSLTGSFEAAESTFSVKGAYAAYGLYFAGALASTGSVAVENTSHVSVHSTSANYAAMGIVFGSAMPVGSSLRLSKSEVVASYGGKRGARGLRVRASACVTVLDSVVMAKCDGCPSLDTVSAAAVELASPSAGFVLNVYGSLLTAEGGNNAAVTLSAALRGGDVVVVNSLLEATSVLKTATVVKAASTYAGVFAFVSSGLSAQGAKAPTAIDASKVSRDASFYVQSSSMGAETVLLPPGDPKDFQIVADCNRRVALGVAVTSGEPPASATLMKLSDFAVEARRQKGTCASLATESAPVIACGQPLTTVYNHLGLQKSRVFSKRSTSVTSHKANFGTIVLAVIFVAFFLVAGVFLVCKHKESDKALRKAHEEGCEFRMNAKRAQIQCMTKEHDAAEIVDSDL